MDENRIPGSFRDPSGFLFRQAGVLYRHVSPAYRSHWDRLMGSGFYARAVADGLLLPHDEIPPDEVPGHAGAYRVLRPEPLGFVSYPYEWSFGQLKDAALLTLALQKRALAAGLWLKDASAYNVQFRAGRPVFIDTLSFEEYPEGRPWVAYQQFCTHFLAPLALAAYRHVGLLGMQRAFLDGVPLDIASRLLPLRTRLRFSLLTHVHAHARSIRAHAARGGAAAPGRVGRTALLGLVDSLEGAVGRLVWAPEGTEWVGYYDATTYSGAAHEHKCEVVAALLDERRPASVWDLGANTGLFSRIAAERGIPTVAFDLDPAAVERSWREVRRHGERNLLPLVMDLGDPSPNLGWDGDERLSLAARGPADLAMALALVHHLAIGRNVPLDRIATFLGRLGRALVVEFVPKTDTQVRRLLATRADIFPDYSEAGFEQAFGERFRLRSRVRLRESERVLYVFET